MATPFVQRLGAPTGRQCLVLHGILGSKTNWRSVIRRVAEGSPGWGFVLPDLRNHGDAPPRPGPHTLDAVAHDLHALGSFDAVLGHSYGGKVALAWTLSVPKGPSLLVSVDANPGARPGHRGAETTMRTLEVLRTMRGPFPSRGAFAEGLMARGLSHDIAAWLAMNVVARDGAWFLRTDVDAIAEMLEDYFARDLWHVVERPPPNTRVLAILGGASSALDPDDRARFAAIARHNGQVRVEVIPEAGHWVHVDAPDTTERLLTEALSTV